MLLQKETLVNKVSIKAYSPGTIKLNIGVFDQAVLLIDGEKIDFEGADRFDELSIESIQKYLKSKPEILIIGSGKEHKILAPEITAKINQWGIAVESMASRQACHTYQVLSHDKRAVSALIFP